MVEVKSDGNVGTLACNGKEFKFRNQTRKRWSTSLRCWCPHCTGKVEVEHPNGGWVVFDNLHEVTAAVQEWAKRPPINE